MIRCVLGDSRSPPRRGGGYTWVARLGIGRSSCKFCLDSILSKNSMHCCYSSESTSALSRASKQAREGNNITTLMCKSFPDVDRTISVVEECLRFSSPFLFLRCHFLRAKLLLAPALFRRWLPPPALRPLATSLLRKKQ